MKIKNTESHKLFNDAKKLMPGGVNSPVRSFKAVGGIPHFISRGDGPFIFDEDNNKFIDFTCSWGPLILGHNNNLVKESIKEVLEFGTSFGTPTRRENLLAKLIIDSVKSIEKVRFVNSGTEATMSAVRLARGYTKRDLIIKFEGCYHGHADIFLSNAGSGLATFDQPTSPGVPQSVVDSTITLDFNNIKQVEDAFKQYKNKIAAIIVEPVTGNMSVIKPTDEFINGLRTLCNNNKSLLIFDEVMTGYRVSHGGAQEFLNVKPDITTLGKVIGGGLPVGAYGGKNEIMSYVSPEGPVYQAGTLSGNPVSMSAGIAMLKQLQDKKVYEYLNEITDYFAHGLNEISKKNNYPLIVNSYCSMIGIFCSKNKVNNYKDITEDCVSNYNSLHKYFLENNIYFPPSAYEALFLSTEIKKEHIDHVLKTFDKFSKQN
tara:strand:+ start:1138 stop:2427 length:1290 start_codon:yes stop_codon:yes gene_type:complete